MRHIIITFKLYICFSNLVCYPDSADSRKDYIYLAISDVRNIVWHRRLFLFKLVGGGPHYNVQDTVVKNTINVLSNVLYCIY